MPVIEVFADKFPSPALFLIVLRKFSFMKLLKWTAVLIGVLLIIIVAAAFILPVVYRDNIKEAVDRQLAASVNADIVYDAANFDVSFFRDFPRITLSTGQVGVFTREPFAGEHLFIAEDVGVSLDLWELITGDQMSIKGVLLEKPDINIRYLADGRANFDISIPATDTVAAEPSAFSLRIDHWEVRDGNVSYDDATIPFAMTVKGMQHSGSGDFTEKAFDLVTASAADSVSVTFDGVEYISDKKAFIEATIGISEDISLFTFKENTARLNEFAFGFNGWFRMNETSYDMDMSWNSKDNSFRSILSLVPGVYSSSFDDIKASGTVDFSGKVKGTFSETVLPAFEFSLTVDEGMFQYPKLPESVKNIAVALHVSNNDGVIENTRVDMGKFHAELGKNPIDARLLVENLRTFPIDASLKTSLNLQELTTIFPIEGITLKGLFRLDAKAKGVYDSVRHIIPAIDAQLALSEGYAKSADYPFAAESITAQARVLNSSGRMSETEIDLSRLAMTLDGESFEASAAVRNLDDYTWNVKARGAIDLGKVMQIFPVDGMQIAGKLRADVVNSGKYSDLSAGRYDKLPASGSASLSGFNLQMRDLPYAVVIRDANMGFDPGKIQLTAFDASVGRSDFKASGIIQDYMGYLFGNDVDLKGSATVVSKLIDLNEFMSESGEEAADTTSMGVVPVPDDIRFDVALDAATIKMMDLTMSDASGKVVIENGTADLRDVKFGLLGGRFSVSGLYDPRNAKQPAYDFGLKIEQLSIRQAAEQFSLVKKFAPIAGQATGNFNLDFKISGALDQQMSPIASSVDASGLIKLITAGVSGSKALSAISSLTSLKDSEKVSLKDVVVSAAIKDGRLSVKPFDVSLGSYKTTVSGSGGLDGSLDYNLKVLVPQGALGSRLAGITSSMTQTKATEDVPVNIRLGGTFSDPKAELLSSEMKQELKETVVKKAEEKGKQAVQEALKGGDAKSVVRSLLKTDSLKAIDSGKAAPTPQKMLEDKLKSMLKKKKKG